MQAPKESLSVVARQPIFDNGLEVVAYELLYRTPGATRADIRDPALATAQVVVGATLDIGFTHLVGSRPAYINFPAEMLASHFQPPASPDRVVVEVLEGALPDPELLACLQRLRAQGHKVALDDYDVARASPLLLDHADIVKLDVQQLTVRELEQSVATLRRHPVRLVAEKIETRQELLRCRELGFDLYQGYFLHKPEIVQARRAACARLSVLDLVLMMNDPEVSAEDLERSICRDVGLSYRILRSINSSYFGLPREISSIRQAIVLLGIGELQKLCWLMLMAGLEGQPAFVCVQSLHRARMCEAMCHASGDPAGELFFMTGMLSALDVLLQQPMEDAIASLPLGREVRGALLDRSGELGAALQCAECFERGEWSNARFRELTLDEIMFAYSWSAQWADCAWTKYSGVN